MDNLPFEMLLRMSGDRVNAAIRGLLPAKFDLARKVVTLAIEASFAMLMGLGISACSVGNGASKADFGQDVSTSIQALKDFIMAKVGLGKHVHVTQPVQYVQLEVLSEVGGGPWASVAELNLIDAAGMVVPRERWKATADSSGLSDPPSSAIDGNPTTVWHSGWEGTPSPQPHRLTIDIGKPTALSGFRYLPRQDKTRNGSIAHYKFFVSNDGKDWGSAVEEGNLSKGASPQSERTVLFGVEPVNHAPVVKPLTAQSTRENRGVSIAMEAEDLDGDPLIFSASGLPPGIVMDESRGLMTGSPNAPGHYVADISVADDHGAVTKSSLEWNVSPTPPDAVRYVRLEAMSEINGGPWTSMAEFNLIDENRELVPRKFWKVSADSYEGSDGPQRAIDGDISSVWHTAWNSASPPQPPHAFTVDLGEFVVVIGFKYLPRQDEVRNGTIGKYRFYVSKDGTQWGEPVSQGDFLSLGQSNTEKTVYLK